MKSMIKKFMILQNEVDLKRKYIWFSLGSGFFALSTLLFTIIVSRSLGKEIGGMFSTGIAIAQWMVTIAYFEIRTYQVTDAKNEFEFNDYFIVRIIMSFLSFATSVGYVIIRHYNEVKIEIVLSLCIYKILEGIGDIFEGEFQKHDRIDVSGKSMFIRTLVSIITLCLALKITNNLFISLIFTNIITAVCIILINFSILKYFSKLNFDFSFQNTKKIIYQCLPLATSNFLNIYIVNSSKLAVDQCLTDEFQLYYTAIFMPNMLINLFSGMMFRPMQTKLAQYYQSREIIKFNKILYKMILIIASFTILCIIGAYLIGIPILSILYNIDLSKYKINLIILLFAGGINAINLLLYDILTIMRKQTYILILYSITAVFALLLTKPMTNRLGLTGASIGYLFTVLLLCSLIVIIIFIINKRIGQEKCL